MGCCLSKKNSSSPASAAVLAAPPPESTPKPEPEEQKRIPHAEAENVKKEVFVIKQRKSHERRPEERVSNVKAGESLSENSAATATIASAPLTSNVTLRTSSCTKEEVDAILIQCGRLSRSSSSSKGGVASTSTSTDNHPRGRKYCGSKRSYDFDQDDNDSSVENKKSSEEDHHHSRPSHRRTPSGEKDVDRYRRSSSRDRCSSSRDDERKRGSGSGSRRASRSPGRRSETPSATTVIAAPSTDKSKPGKMVSVPASVSNRDKTVSGDSSSTVVKRVSVKRSIASPRSQSPAYSRPNNNNNNSENAQHHQQPSLSRNSSRKAEHSPYRRNPMSEIDDNCLRKDQLIPLKCHDQIDSSKAPIGLNRTQRRKEGDEVKALPSQNQKTEERNGRTLELAPGNNNSNSGNAMANVMNHQTADQQQQGLEEEITEVKGLPPKASETSVPLGATAAGDNLIPPQAAITRSRSSRRSRDLDVLNLGFNPDNLLNPTSYASLLLEDIQNFHHQQQNTAPAFSLPPCVTKACSILEAVAGLNSCTSSNLSCAFSEERSSEAADWSNNKNIKNASSSSNPHLGKKSLEVKDPFVESEVLLSNDLNEPSLHKYVTVRRGVVTKGGEEVEQQESSGSNSFVGGHNWAATAASSSSWEPNSAESSWTSRSNTGEEFVLVHKETNVLDPENQLRVPAVAHDTEVNAKRLRSGNRGTQFPSATQSSGKKRELYHHQQQQQQHVRVRQGKVGAISQAIPVAASASL